MLNRAIRDIHNLVRVHKVVGDVGLRQVLEDKLRRLNVRAALPPVNATTAKRMGSGGGGWSTSSAASTYTIEPNALCQLLECLAYTQFTSEEVTMDAIALAQKSIPEMNASFIAKTVAACCALGQHDASIPVIPMLTSAIHNATDGVPPASLANTNNNSSANVRDGADLVQLMEALHTVDVRQEELWTLLAEHCVRCLPLLSGKQLVRVAELLCERRVSRDGRDFFVAAEHHIANKPPHFLNADQLQRLTAIYSTLGLPTVALASSSSGQLVRRFDRGLTAMAHGGSSSSSSSAMAAEQHTGDLTDFLRTALGAFASASPTDLLELLQVCATKEFAHPSLVEAAAKRLEQLYFGQTSPSSSSTSTAEGRKPLARGAWSAADINAISQILVQLMRGEDAALYIEAAPLLSAMLDAMAEDVLQSPHHHRLLLLAEQALTYFPKTSQPTHLYEALVHHLRMASDMSSNEGPRRLQRLVTVLLALPSQGGHAVLEQHMPGLAVSIAHTPRRVQLSMAAQLCHLPAARTELLPSVFRSIVAKRLWFSTLTPIEARDLITSLSRSHARDQEELLQGLVQYLRSHKTQLLPVDITQHLHALALLGVREVEFFTTMAESLLNSLSSTQQPTTIHDLCLLLYTFTLVLNDVIRVVQQLLARTKVAVGQATPRDVVLLLYSLAALRVVRHGDVSQPFCQRATSILAEFSAEQLTSMWSSLRALGMCPQELWRSTEVWLRADTNRRLVGSTSSSPTNSPSTTWPRLRDVQYASLVHSILAARHAELQHNSAAARRPAEAAGASSEPMEEQLLFVLPHYQRIAVGLLAAMHRAPHKEWSRSDGLLVHGIIITLSGLKASLSTTEWAVLCATAEKCSEVLCPSLRADEDCRAAAAEVLKYLRELHPLQETPASSSTALSSPEIQACVVAAEEWGKSPPRLVAAAAAVPAVSAKRAPSRRTKNSKKR